MIKETLEFANKCIGYCDLGNTFYIAVLTKKAIYDWKYCKTGQELKKMSKSKWIKEFAYYCCENNDMELYQEVKYDYKFLCKMGNNQAILVIYNHSDYNHARVIESIKDLEEENESWGIE